MHTNTPPPPLPSGTAYDVIIVGARAAGAATAMLLGRSDLRILLLDQDPIGSDTLSAPALMRGGVLQLALRGLLDEIVAAGTPAVKRTTFRYGDENIVITIKPSHGVDALYAPRRTLLDPLLVRAAVDAGVEAHHRTRVTGLITNQGRVAGVHALTPDRRPLELGASLVIGADGVHSTIARHVDAPLIRVGKHASATTYAYWPDLATDGYEWSFRRDASSGVIPTNNGLTCVLVNGTRERIGNGGVEVITEAIAEGAPDLSERLRAASPPQGSRTWTGRHGYIRRSFGPGWALVGDAGYFKDPISAHGLTDALRDAELLAGAVVAGIDDERSLAAALAEYQATRDRLSLPLFDIVDRIAGHQWDDAEIGRLLLQLSSATVDEVETMAALETGVVS